MEIPYYKRLHEGAVATSEACFGVVTEGVLPLGHRQKRHSSKTPPHQSCFFKDLSLTSS